MDKSMILSKFRTEFNAPEIETFDEFLVLVSMNKSIQKWYSSLKMEISIYDEIPDSFRRAGVTSDLWKNLEVQRDKVRNANRIYSQKVNEASKQLVKAMEEADKERENTLSTVDMLIKLLGYTVNELPIHYQMQLSKIKDLKQRKSKAKEFIDIELEGLVRNTLIGKDLPYNPF